MLYIIIPYHGRRHAIFLSDAPFNGIKLGSEFDFCVLSGSESLCKPREGPTVEPPIKDTPNTQ